MKLRFIYNYDNIIIFIYFFILLDVYLSNLCLLIFEKLYLNKQKNYLLNFKANKIGDEKINIYCVEYNNLIKMLLIWFKKFALIMRSVESRTILLKALNIILNK